MRPTALLFALSLCTAAEVHTLTLKETLDRALTQNPDILIARFEEQKAAANVRVVRDPFSPRLYAGSGLAYTGGFPLNAPSVFQSRAVQTIYNRPLSYQVAAAREQARGAVIDTEARREEVVHRILLMYLSAARADRILQLVQQQQSSFEAIANTVRARVEEGRELPVEARAAELRVAQARQRIRTLELERDQTESSLAIALGYAPEDRVRAAREEKAPFALPNSETEAVEQALAGSKQVKRLESALQAKQLEVRSAASSWYPQIDLVAQYALMARFNNYEDFYRRFERNNWQLGMSFQLPIFAGSGPSAQKSIAELEMARIRQQIQGTRNRISVDARKAWQELRNAESARDVARMDLDVTRERLSVALAQLEEGRTPLRQVEELRSAESEKWLAFYDAQHGVEQARLELLRQTGTILAALK